MGEVDYVNFDTTENGTTRSIYSCLSPIPLCKPISTQLLPKIFAFIFLADVAFACWFLARLMVLDSGYDTSILHLAFYSVLGLANFG